MASEEAKKAAQKEVEKRLAPMMRALNIVRETNDKGRQALKAWADSKTRPAPDDLKARDRKHYKLIRKSLQNKGLLPTDTDTGLVTKGYLFKTLTEKSGWFTKFSFTDPTQGGLPYRAVEKLCLQSQAEELLAAEREKKTEIENAWLEALVSISELKANNAAKDARIKELDSECNELVAKCNEIIRQRDHALNTCAQMEEDKDALEAKLETYHEEYENRKEGYEKTIDSLEEKLAASEEALEPFAKIPVSTVPEGRLGHVPDKHPCMFDLDGNVLFTASDLRKARAVLGGKSDE